jgi:hypothetical protein
VGRPAGGPHHERVVGVGHHAGGGQGAERVAPPVGDLAHLVAAVELIAAEVEQRHRGWADRLEHRRQPPLVDLEHRGGTGLGPAERGDEAGGHVGPEEVGDHRPRSGERGGQQVGGGGLAVGAADQGDGPIAGEPFE